MYHRIPIPPRSRTMEHFKKLLAAEKRKAEARARPVKPEDVTYPQILSLEPKDCYLRLRDDYHTKIREEIGTVEEKIHILNLPKFYGWPSFIVKEGVLPYNCLPFAQYITRSVVNENKNLPLYNSDDKTNRLKNQLKSELEKFFVFENSIKHRHDIEPIFANEENLPYYSKVEKSDLSLKHLVKQLNSIVTKVLAPEYPHLLMAQVDLEPRLEAFWRVGGFHPTTADKKLRKEKDIAPEFQESPIDRFFQYFGSPILQVRSNLPLPIIDVNLALQENINEEPNKHINEEPNEHINEEPNKHDSQNTKNDFYYPPQEYRYTPDLYLNVPRERQHGTIVPGFWPNDPCKFGIVSYHSSNHLNDRPAHYGEDDAIEALHAQALLASYAWTYGLACYQGFTTYNDLTYPFTNQQILTDGKMFSFYQYQLNTILMHGENIDENPIYNKCFATAPTELYHSIGVDKVQGWNDEALLNLLAIYTNVPSDRPGVNLCPYLNADCKYISKIENADERVWWHKAYNRLISRRPRYKLAPEIYDWERIYKIENKGIVTDARKRFFEKFEDPIFDRKMYEHSPTYVKKEERRKDPNLPTRKPMYYKRIEPSYPEIV